MAVCSGQRTPPPANNPVPARVQRALDKGLSIDPAERFSSVALLLEELRPRRARRPRSMWWGLGGASMVVGVYAAFPAAEDPCASGGERVQPVWSATRADALRERFAGLDASFAADSANAVVERLDAYSADWSSAHRDACEATHVRREQSEHALDLRMSCLSQHLQALQSTVETLEEADEAVVEQAPRAVNRLPPLQQCSDVDALDTWARPPDDPGLAVAVQDLRERIAGLTARARLATSESANEDVAGVLREAEATAHGPLIAEARFLAARFAIADGDVDRGVDHLEETLYTSMASNHDRMLALALVELTQSVGILRSRCDEGLKWSRQAVAALARLGDEGPEAAGFHSVMCKLLADKGDTEDALPHCHRAVELHESVDGVQSLHAASAHESLGIALFYAHQTDAALEEFELARDMFAAAEGEAHPDLARIANSLAAICYQTSGAEPCVARFEDAVARASLAYGDDHPMTSDFRNNLALAQAETGQLEAARTNAGRALAARRDKTGDDHPGVAASLRILADVDRSDGDLGAAQEKLVEALAIARRTRGDEHRDVVATLTQLAELALERHAPAEAREHIEAATRSAGTTDEIVVAAREQLADYCATTPSPGCARSAERSAGTR